MKKATCSAPKINQLQFLFGCGNGDGGIKMKGRCRGFDCGRDERPLVVFIVRETKEPCNGVVCFEKTEQFMTWWMTWLHQIEEPCGRV